MILQVPPDNTVAHYAGGSAFAYLLVDRVLTFVNKMRGNGDSGSKNPDYWKAEIRAGVKEVIEDSNMTSTLRDIRDGIVKLVTLTENRHL